MYALTDARLSPATALREPRSLAPPLPAWPASANQSAVEPDRPSAELLLQLPLLCGLTETQAAELAAQGQLLSLRRGALVVEQASVQDQLFVLLDGRAQLVHTADNGRMLLMGVLRPGDFFGEKTLIDGQSHGATLRCMQPSQWLVLPGAAFRRSLRQSALLSQTLLQALVQRLREANRRITSLALDDVHARVINHLCELGETQADGWYEVPGRVSRTEMARLLGASREMVCRVLAQLERRGELLRCGDGSLRVRRVEATEQATGEVSAETAMTYNPP